ncbi:MAG: hypothetical protein AAB332_03725, partial [Planctomycetota bacterium]
MNKVLETVERLCVDTKARIKGYIFYTSQKNRSFVNAYRQTAKSFVWRKRSVVDSQLRNTNCFRPIEV